MEWPGPGLLWVAFAVSGERLGGYDSPSIIIGGAAFINCQRRDWPRLCGGCERREGFCRPVSRVLFPSHEGRTVTIYLAQPSEIKPVEVRLRRSDVTAAVKQPTRGQAGRLSPPIWPCSRWGLAAVASPQTAGRSYRPISPLPRQFGAVCFCATFRSR